jgi:23S rRNA-/tRNA-specific pseudouridylate synthase
LAGAERVSFVLFSANKARKFSFAACTPHLKKSGKERKQAKLFLHLWELSYPHPLQGEFVANSAS